MTKLNEKCECEWSLNSKLSIFCNVSLEKNSHIYIYIYIYIYSYSKMSRDTSIFVIKPLPFENYSTHRDEPVM